MEKAGLARMLVGTSSIDNKREKNGVAQAGMSAYPGVRKGSSTGGWENQTRGLVYQQLAPV